MAADYPTSVKSFATKVDNVDLVMAADINDLQTEVAAIENHLITSKLATLTTAPTASKVLTTDGSGNPTWATKAPDADKLDGVDSSLYVRQNAAPSGNQVLTTDGSGVPTWSDMAFTSYTPTLTSGSGTFTDASVTGYYFQIGKLVFVKISVSIATNGTAAASVIVTLPITQKNTFMESFCGSAIVSATGAQKGTLQAQSHPTGKVRIYKYDGTYPGENGVMLIVSGFYEVE